jgi:hypothetical protein
MRRRAKAGASRSHSTPHGMREPSLAFTSQPRSQSPLARRIIPVGQALEVQSLWMYERRGNIAGFIASWKMS